MDNDSEAFVSHLLNWLQQDSAPTPAPNANAIESYATGADLEIDSLDPLDWEEVNVVHSSTDEATLDREPSTGGVDPTKTAASPSSSMSMTGYIGGIPTVQNRFHALLKRRLQEEIKGRPPLFPWETPSTTYGHDISDVIADTWFPQINLWMPQIYDLNLPVTLPETVLAQLLTACTQAVLSPLQPEAKWVRAVANMFPSQSPAMLNDLAGSVRLYPTRGDREQQLFTNGYDEATPKQQMALSLLGAKYIIDALTLSLSPTQTLVEKHWQTSVGQISLQAEYQLLNQVSKLRVQSRLPRGGSLTLQTAQASARAERTYPGYLSVESFDFQPNQTYPLEIQFSNSAQEPLILAIALSNGNG